MNATAQPPHNNRPDNQADWLMDLLDEIQGYIDDDELKLTARVKAHQAITAKIAAIEQAAYTDGRKAGNLEAHLDAKENLKVKIAEERLKEAKAFRGVSGDSARAYAIERIKVLEAGLKGE